MSKLRVATQTMSCQLSLCLTIIALVLLEAFRRHVRGKSRLGCSFAFCVSYHHPSSISATQKKGEGALSRSQRHKFVEEYLPSNWWPHLLGIYLNLGWVVAETVGVYYTAWLPRSMARREQQQLVNPGHSNNCAAYLFIIRQSKTHDRDKK